MGKISTKLMLAYGLIGYWDVAIAFAQNKDAAIESAADAIEDDYERVALDQIKSFCDEKWAKDFVMQRYCIDKNTSARSAAQAFDVMGSSDNMIIWGTCMSRWSDELDRVDWVMAAYCIEQQEEALKKIRN